MERQDITNTNLENSMVDTKDRIMGIGDFIWLWLGMTAQMGVFLLGASFTGRISYLQALIAMIVGNLIVSVILILNGDVGTKYGLNFSLYLRAPFGEHGRKIPTFMRALTGIFWFGIQTYYGALAIDIAIEYLTGFSNWFLWYIVFAIVQILITAGGIGWIKYIENIAGPALAVLSLWLIYVLVKGHSFGEFIAMELNDRLNFWAVVTANLSYWVTVAVNISDFTRHIVVEEPDGSFIKRNKVSIFGQVPGITIGMVLFISVGMIGKYYTGHGNPVDMISSSLGGYFMLVGLLIILLAQLSTNVAANLYAPGNILSDIFSEKLNFSKAVLVAGGIGMFTFPWYLLDHFLTYLPLVGAFLSPLPGIMIVDYYLIRKTNLDMNDFRELTDRYEYSNGFNPAALITYVVAGLVGIRFLKYSWLVSLPTAALLYYILMNSWIKKKYPNNVL
jgi:NCS1 family nucleobase:cation symporter-1